MSESTPGWQADPTGKHDHRYWDGSQWTDNVSNGGVASTDAFEPAATADAGDMGDMGDPAGGDIPAVGAAAAPPPPAPIDPTVVGAAPPAPDATSAWPTTPAAPGAPAPPPPYVPTDPVSSGGDGGSKRGLLIGGGILAAVAVAVVLFLSLGKDDDSSVRTELASKIQEQADGISGDQAECVADLLIDEAGEDTFKDVDFNAEDAPPEVVAAFLAVGEDRLVEECDIDKSQFSDGGDDGATDGSGGEGSYGSDAALDALYDDCEDGDYAACDQLFFDSPADSEYEDFGDTCGERNEPSGTCVELYGDGGGDSTLPDNFEDILADTYEESLGLSRDKAECLAGRLAEVIEDGTLNEEQAMSEFMDYLADCDISMEEIGGN